MKKKIIIIAEGGVNHNGKLDIAKKIINEAQKSGADYVKFQCYKTENLIVENAKLANYQMKNLKTNINDQYKLLKNLELSHKNIKSIVRYAKLLRIKIIFSIFDIDSYYFIKKLNLDYIKIPSGEINNLNLLKVIAKDNNKIIISTGMSDIDEIKKAIKVLTRYGTKIDNLTVLHCNTDYPTPIQDINMRAMITIKEKLKVNVGYSDHSIDRFVPVIATSLGANIIEKHFTIDQKLLGPDHKASLNPKSFKEMVSDIRNTELILGSEKKDITKSERKNLNIVRKSIVANCDISKGQKFTTKNISIKRPGGGLPPSIYDSLIGKIAKHNYKTNQKIK